VISSRINFVGQNDKDILLGHKQVRRGHFQDFTVISLCKLVKHAAITNSVGR
jgi:hypothetical protein